jgi:hypothetical protein
MIDWATIGSLATAFAVLVAAWQVRRSTQQARTQFEDELNREYRQLSREIDVDALLGDPLTPDCHQKAFPALVRYIDLSNEQVFLREKGRVSRDTWESWRDGIRSNLARPAFNTAWCDVKERAAKSFQELRRLEDTRFTEDPRRWVAADVRLRRWLSGA